MRIVDQVYRDVSPSELDEHETETAHVLLFSGKRSLQSELDCARLAFARQSTTDRRNRIASQVHREARPAGCCHASSRVSPLVVKRRVLVASGRASIGTIRTWLADIANMRAPQMWSVGLAATCLIWTRPQPTRL